MLGQPIDPEQEKAAQLIAAGELTNTEIADKIGVHRNTISRWLNDPAFAACVEDIRQEFCQAVRRRGIAILERRVEALNDRWHRLQDVIEARANDPELADVAGGKTGLIVRDLKGIGKGDDFQVVETYSVDTGLLKELREHEKQAAQELGQWTDKKEVTGADGGPLAVMCMFDQALGKVYGDDGTDPSETT